MAVFRLPSRWCWSGRQALVVLLLVIAYMTLMLHRPASQQLITITSPAVLPLVADTSPARRPHDTGRTVTGRPAHSASHSSDQQPVTATQQPTGSAHQPEIQPAGQANDPARADTSSGHRGGTVNIASDRITNGDSDANAGDTHGGNSSRSAGSPSGSTSNRSSDSASDSISDSRCVSDRASDDREGRPCAESEQHGPDQRVISYSLFQADGGHGQPPDGQGDQDGWGWLIEGLEINAALSVRLFPGWRIRVYHDTAAGTSRRARLTTAACRHRHVDLCYIRETNTDTKGVYQGALWRFFPLVDPLVDAFVSRDLDSRLSQREATAVQHWLATNRTFHIMRDHWDHLIPVPGGLWGARPNLRRQLADKLGTKLDRWAAHPGHKNWDQRALHSVVWFHASVDSVQHDSYTCRYFPGYTIPFPTRRSENDTTVYLGQVMRRGESPRDEKLKECPTACRPPDHKDWKYC